jgi:hypothetical protein
MLIRWGAPNSRGTRDDAHAGWLAGLAGPTSGAAGRGDYEFIMARVTSRGRAFSVGFGFGSPARTPAAPARCPAVLRLVSCWPSPPIGRRAVSCSRVLVLGGPWVGVDYSLGSCSAHVVIRGNVKKNASGVSSRWLKIQNNVSVGKVQADRWSTVRIRRSEYLLLLGLVYF